MADEEADNASKDDAESKKDDDAEAKQDKSKQDDDAESKQDKPKEDKPQHSAAPHWGTKALRVFLFATLGTFLAALLFGDSLPSGLRVDFDLIASIKLGLISGVISALLRALAAMLPLFADD